MLKKIDLRTEIYFILASLGCISLLGGLVMIWYTFQMKDLLSGILEKNVAAFQAAEALETALVNQKGFVTYYYLDGNEDWLRRFYEYRKIFKQQLDAARLLAQNNQQLEAIRLIEQQYDDYSRLKDKVIGFYISGEREQGARLHNQVRNQFADILNRCEDYKKLHTDSIRLAQASNTREADRLRYIALAAIILTSGLTVLMALILTKQILGPLNRMLRSATGQDTVDRSSNMVAALDQIVKGLVLDVDQTQQALAKSREHLLQSEKLAMVGKLAAGMAHSIRNPFTSVKMRLFSLNRSLKLSPAQKEDFDVITQEIRHIDTIVQNFLEFSRPPKLVMQWVSPSTIVDNTLLLLAHRLKAYNVTIKIMREDELPEVFADPEQIKEVLVNIIINACEAMTTGGRIVVQEEVSGSGDSKMVNIQITDTGPGVPVQDRDTIFQPFFTTKNDGTGLGLSIARNILDEHGGKIIVQQPDTGGACFLMTLPLSAEKDHEHHPDN